MPEWVRTGKPRGAGWTVQGASCQPGAEGAGGGVLGMQAPARLLVDGRGPGGQVKEPLPQPQPQASAGAPRQLGDVQRTYSGRVRVLL